MKILMFLSVFLFFACRMVAKMLFRHGAWSQRAGSIMGIFYLIAIAGFLVSGVCLLI